MTPLDGRCHGNAEMEALVHPDLHQLLLPWDKPGVLAVLDSFRRMIHAKAVEFRLVTFLGGAGQEAVPVL